MYASVNWAIITWTKAGLVLIGLLATNFSEIWIGIISFSFKKSFENDVYQNDSHFVQGEMS